MKLLVFKASWCAPCKLLSPVLKKVMEDYPNIHYEEVSIDETANIEKAKEFVVRAVPTLVIIGDSNIEISRKVGALTESKIRDWLEDNKNE